MFMFTFAAILDLAVSVPVVQPPPITDALPPGAVVRMGTARFFHFDPITWVGFASDGRTVLTAGSEYHIRFSDAATGRESTRFRSYTSPRAGFALSADGKRLALNQSDEMKILDVISRKEIRCFSQDELLGPKGERFFIHRFTLSPDGRFLAIWDEQPPNVSVPEEVKRFRRFSVDVWDVDTGRRVGAWKVGDLHEIEFTPDGKTLVAQEQTKEDRLRRWDIASGKEIRSLELPRQLVRYVFLPDGKTLVGMNTARNALHLHETATGRELRTVADAAGPIFAFALSADGANLAIARPGRLLVQRLADGKTTLDVPFPHHPVVDGYRHRTHADLLAFAPDGKTLAVAKGRSLEVWNLTTGTRVHPDDNMAGPVLAVHTHGRHLLARDMDLNLSLWDLRSGKLLRRFVRVASPGPEDGIQYSTAVFCFDWAGGCQEISADGRHVAALWFDGPIHLFDLASGVRIRSFEGSDKATCLAFSPNGKLLAGPSANGQIGIWNVTTGKLVQRLMPAVRPDNPDNAPAVLALHFSPDGRTLTAGACKEGDVCEVSCWELATGNLRSFLRPKGKSTRSGYTPHGLTYIDPLDNLTLSFVDAPDGQHFAAAGPRTIRLWDRGSDKEVRRFGGADVVGQSAVFSPDGKLVAAGIEKGGIRFWDAATATVLRDVPAHRATVTSLAFPDGGKTLVSGSLDGTAIVWDLDRLLNETSADKAELEQLWTALGQPDAEKAAQAMRAFAARPKETRAFFKERIRPIPIVDAKRLDQLLIDLHSNQFAVRQRANDELEKLDGQARSALEKALQDDPAVETRRRIETLLQRLEPPISAPHLLRNLRAIEVTERIGTAEAYAFLQLLADGGAGHRLTEQAREAVVRLTKRP